MTARILALPPRDPDAPRRRADIARFTGMSPESRYTDAVTARTMRAATVDGIIAQMAEDALEETILTFAIILHQEGRLDGMTLAAFETGQLGIPDMIHAIFALARPEDAALYLADMLTLDELVERILESSSTDTIHNDTTDAPPLQHRNPTEGNI